MRQISPTLARIGRVHQHVWAVGTQKETHSRFGAWVVLAVCFALGCEEDLSAARLPGDLTTSGATTGSGSGGSGGSGPTSGTYEAEGAFPAGTATLGSSLAGVSGTGY